MQTVHRQMLVLAGLTVVLMSIPWLVPHMGWTALIGLAPLLLMESLADRNGVRGIFWWYYLTFLAWNAATTFWVCNATVGGGIFASAANALQMAAIFAIFRLYKKRSGRNRVWAYIFLAVAWTAWERFYYGAEISWPWLVLGGAFARSTKIVQWYEFTGILGGSVWIWTTNLLLFAFLRSRATTGTIKGRPSIASGLLILAAALPMSISVSIYDHYKEVRDGTLDILIAQPDFDPYEKFESLSQQQQNDTLITLLESRLPAGAPEAGKPLLILAPETFTGDVILDNIRSGRTWNVLHQFLQDYPGANILFGASTYEYLHQHRKPDVPARKMRDGVWLISHNSALITDHTGRTDVYHKSKLVVGTEKTPYPKLFVPLDDKLGGLMGRCVGQDGVSLLNVRTYGPEGTASCDIPIGCAVCYESVYGEYCTGYVRKGARALAVITNDAWWGDTPGYRQHLSYSSLRAIELRRDIARCANTGISAIIDQRGEIQACTEWWTKATLEGTLNLSDRVTFFAAHGDIAGRTCTAAFLAALLLLLLSFVIPSIFKI